MKFYLDSSFVLSLLIEDHIFQERAKKFLSGNEGEFYISTITLLETVYNLQKLKYDTAIIKNIVEEFLNTFLITEFDLSDFIEAISHSNMKIFDALHYVLARKVNAKLVTFDKDFEGLEDVIILE